MEDIISPLHMSQTVNVTTVSSHHSGSGAGVSGGGGDGSGGRGGGGGDGGGDDVRNPQQVQAGQQQGGPGAQQAHGQVAQHQGHANSQ